MQEIETVIESIKTIVYCVLSAESGILPREREVCAAEEAFPFCSKYSYYLFNAYYKND